MLEVPGEPRRQVVLTLQGQRVTIQSTMPPGPDGWAMIRSICFEGVLAAHAEWLKAQSAVVTPTLVAPADMRLVNAR